MLQFLVKGNGTPETLRVLRNSAGWDSNFLENAGLFPPSQVKSHHFYRYNVVLGRVKTSGIHFARWNGLLMGLSEFLLFLSYCITIYVGTNLVYDGTMKPGVVITVALAIPWREKDIFRYSSLLCFVSISYKLWLL